VARGRRCHILDAGCGVGFIAARLADRGHVLTGTDVSVASVELARETHERSSLCFEVSDTTEAMSSDGFYDVVVANMVLHNTPDARGFLRGVHKLLQPSGILLITMTDPLAYLRKQGISHAYEVERRFSFPLRPSCSRRNHDPVPYWHRPVRAYHAAIHD